MNSSLPNLNKFQWLMLDFESNEIPSQVLNSMPLTQHESIENQPETLPIRLYPLVAKQRGIFANFSIFFTKRLLVILLFNQQYINFKWKNLDALFC